MPRPVVREAVLPLPGVPHVAAPHSATPLWGYVRETPLPVVLSVPIIYALIVPFLLLDISVTLYHAICFPIYGIPQVVRSDYLIFDRSRLAYLNAIEKVGCAFCSYANGLLAYIAEIAGRTEHRFCPIKHASSPASHHSHYGGFAPYGDARAYHGRPKTGA